MKICVVLLLLFSSFVDGKIRTSAASRELPGRGASSSIERSLHVANDVTVNVTWTFVSEQNATNVSMIVTSLEPGQYAAVGLGQNQSMGQAHVFMCKRLTNDTVVLGRYINPDGHQKPVPAQSEQGGELTYGEQTYQDGVVTCRFALSRFNVSALKQVGDLRPLSPSASYYPLIASGPLNSTNEPLFHQDTYAAFTPTVQLNRQETILYGITTTTSGTTQTTATNTASSTTSTASVSTSTAVPITTTTIQTTTVPSGSVGIDVSWAFTTGSNVTNITITVVNLQSAHYAALGLGQNQSMGEAHVFMCKRLSNDTVVLSRYINPLRHQPPESAGAEQGGTLTYGEQTYRDGVVTCRFALSNFNSETLQEVGTLRPLSQAGSYHPLFAVGTLDDSNEPNKHDEYSALPNTVQLDKAEAISYGQGTTTQSPISTTTTASPTADVGVNVTLTYFPTTKVTNVTMTVTNLKQPQYAAFGFGQNQAMGEAHVFICKLPRDSKVNVSRYINPSGHQSPKAAGSEKGGVMSYGQQQYSNGVVICQFTLSNFTNAITSSELGELRPLSQSGSYYPLFAIGFLDEQNEPEQHAADSRMFQTETVQLTQSRTILYRVSPPSTSSKAYFQTHGILMIVAWMFFASTAALVARYFKKTWANHIICGKAAWYSVHRFVMSLVVVLTVLAFLFVLVALQGKWVGSDEDIRHFLHSIAGVITIAFAFFQPFIALFRCEPDSRYRFIFNYIHAFVGLSAFTLSIVTLFFATYFDFFKGDNRARAIMIVWTVWIVFIYAAFEFVQRYFAKRSQSAVYVTLPNKTVGEVVDTPMSPTMTHPSDEQTTSTEEKIKNVLLALHILIAAILTICFSVLVR